MIKEWSSIDQWRIDKYYLLIRRVLRHNFKYLKLHQWDETLVNDWVDVMRRTILSGDAKVPVALPYHLCDIYLDELQLILFEELEEEELDKEDPGYLQKYENLMRQKIEIADGVPVLKLIGPFQILNKEAKLKPLRRSVKRTFWMMKDWLIGRLLKIKVIQTWMKRTMGLRRKMMMMKRKRNGKVFRECINVHSDMMATL